MPARPDGAAGPLKGLRLVEFAGIGPAPFAVMLLADLGVEVIRIDRAGAEWPEVPIVSRGRAKMMLDLKHEEDAACARDLVAAADILVEGFRPGVMERLGLGPDEMMRRNPRLVYGRMTGWGQTGSLAQEAGHDINYIGLTGMLASLGRDGAPPVAPLNLLGDYGAGGLYLALGILAAVYERERSGTGQVIDAAIVDGAASLFAPILGMIAAGLLPRNPAEGMLAGGHSFYRTYACADGRFLAVGALEPRFRACVADVIGVEAGALGDLSQAARIEAVFASRTRDEWLSAFAGTDCCVSPVLDPGDAVAHPHLAERGVFVGEGAGIEPAPAPRFSRTPGAIQPDGDAVRRLEAWGVARRRSSR